MSGKPLHIFVPHSSEMLTDHLPNGDGLIAYGFIRHLAERGHTLHVVACQAELRDPLPPNVHLKIIGPRTGRGPISAFHRLEYMLRMRRHFHTIRRYHPIDLIHQLNPVFAGISLALWDADLPLVLGTFVARWPDQPGATPLRRFIQDVGTKVREGISERQQQRASILLLTAPAARNRLPHAGQLDRRIRWLGHGIDTEVFSPASDAQSPEHLAAEQASPSILFLANLSERKGVFPLLQAFAFVLRQLPNARLTIAGDGPALHAMRKLAGELRMTQAVDFIGNIPRTAVPDLYRSHALYCLPAFGEPYATSILEAMACGRPIVITDTGGIPDMIDPEGGPRVPAGDPEALAAALLHVLTDSEARRAMGAANRNRALATMTWPTIIEQLESVYYDLLAKPDATERS